MEFSLNTVKKNKGGGNKIQTTFKFRVDEDSESEEENEIKKVNKDLARAVSQKKTFSKEAYEALAEDPTIFCYDLYKSKQILQKKEAVQSTEAKYHKQLKENADFRKKEREVIKERVELKLREIEKEEFGETEVYYTSSYLKFIKENKSFEQKLDAKDKQSELNSIEFKKPEGFLNNIIVETRGEEPYKRKKIENNEDTSIINPEVNLVQETETQQTDISDKRSESQISCAKERYLARIRSKGQL